MTEKMNFFIIVFINLTFHIVLCKDTFFIRINNIDYLLDFETTDAAEQIKSKIPFTHKMTNFNKSEVYYKFKDKFTKNEKNIPKTQIGGIYLYKNDILTLFYKEIFSTNYYYTKIGKLGNITNINLTEKIGPDDVTVQWCINSNCVDSFSFISTNYLLILALILLLF